MIKQNSNTTYRTDIGNIRIQYSTKQIGDTPVESVNANIQQDDESLGSANIERDRSIGFSLKKGISAEDQISVFSTIVKDADEIFNPKSE